MHALSFYLKRAHLTTLAITRPVARLFDLTPARYDVLHALDEMGCTQAQLRAILAVSRATVSRMLNSLEKLGFIRRCVAYDRRTRSVSITAEGRARVRAAQDCAITESFQIAFESYFGSYLGPLSDAAFMGLYVFATSVQYFARYLGDTSSLNFHLDEPDLRFDVWPDGIEFPDDFSPYDLHVRFSTTFPVNNWTPIENSLSAQ